MVKTLLAAGLVLAASTMPMAADSGVRRLPCGYQQITTLSTAQSLSIPAACSSSPALAVITAETQAVRYRDDAVAPTATVGQPLAVGAVLSYEGNISAIQFIEQTASAKLNISYYR